MALAGSLEIQLLANVARLQSDMTSAKGAVGSAMKSIESSVAMAKSALGALGIGLGVGYFVSLTKGAIDAADKINDLSQSMGVAVRDLGAYKLATEQSGTTLEGMARGVKGLATAFAEHGAELKAAGITAESTDGKMRQIADMFAAMPDGIEKTTLAVKLFGKSGMELIPMLNMGSQGLAETAEKSAKYAAVLATLAPQADKFNDTLAELGMASKVASLSLVNDALPAMSRIAAAMAVAAHESGMLKAAWVGFGGIAWEGIFKPLTALIKGTTANLFELNAGMLKFFGQNASAAAEYQKAAKIWKEIAALEEPPDVHKPEKVFDSDKWVTQYKKMLAALGVEGKKAKAQAGMSVDELLFKGALTSEKYIRELEDAATKAAEVVKAVEDAARAKSLEGDMESLAARWEAAEENARQIGQLDLKRIKDTNKAELEAAKKLVDYRVEQEKEITRGLTDALMRGFDGGKSFARNFWDTMVNMAKTIVLRPIIEGVLSPVSAAVASGLYGGAASAAGSAAGSSLIGNAAGSAAGSAATGGYLASVGGWMGAAGGVPVTSTVGAVASGAGYAGAGSTGMIGTVASAIPVYGWIALAAIAAYAIWSENEDDRPRNATLGINTSGIGGPAGVLAVTQSGLAGGEDVQQWRDINAWLDQLPDRLKLALDNLGMEFAPGTASADAWATMETQINVVANDLKLTAEEMQHLDTISNQTTYAANQAAKALEVAAVAQEDYTAAMNLQAATMTSLERMLPVQAQVSLAQGRLNAVLRDYNLVMPETVQAAYDYMATLDPMSRQYQDLAAVVDDFGIVMKDTESSVADTASSVESSVDDLSRSLLSAFVRIRPEWQADFETYSQQSALDQFQDAGLLMDQTLESITETLHTGTQEELTNYLQWLLTLSPALQNAALSFMDLISAAEESSASVSQLNDWLDNIALDSQLSPLTAQAKLDAAQSVYVEDLMRAQGGDATALANITKEADAYLAAQKAMSGFGGDYSAVYAAVVNQIASLARTTGSDRPLSGNDIDALKEEVTNLTTVLARLLEQGNEDTVELQEEMSDGLVTLGDRISAALSAASIVDRRQ